MVEIAKALSYNADIIVMDEPTATLTDNEVGVLYRIIEELKSREISIIYISHKMDEIFKLADRITVMRDGHIISTSPNADTSRAKVISEMVGRSMDMEFPSREALRSDEIVLEVKNLYSKNTLNNISFVLKKGEILGIAGLVGSGRTELVRALFGADPSSHDAYSIHGTPVKIKKPAQAIKNGLALLTEDRKEQGLALGFGVDQNISVTNLNKISQFGLLRFDKEKNYAMEYIDTLAIKTPKVNQKCLFLSGGNQQKVVLSKWLFSESNIIILDEPTRGIDVGSKYEIYLLMNQLVSEGKSIIMISSEMPEILAMSDRIIVLHEGSLKGELDNAMRDVTAEQVMREAIK